ncbi:hypothetical protein ACFOLG_10335 [Vogesella facilis]|uniref:Uncharacterized protein n=1 Tax=Vogesella facilis TaxID=1655232 RepID=A0ABV7RI50_9NEIS
MSLLADEFKEQLPAVVLSTAGLAAELAKELPGVGVIVKAVEIALGVEAGVLQQRWQAGVQQRLDELCADVQQLQSTLSFIPLSVDSLTDEQLLLIRQVQQLIVDSPSRDKRKAAARVLCYSTLVECDLGFDMATQFLRDLSELENHHLVVLKSINLQSTDSLVMAVPTSLQESFTPVIYEKIFRDLIKLGFISNSDGTFDGLDLKRTEYLKFFVDYLLQDIQS